MIPSSIARLGSPCPPSREASGILRASLNGVTCSTSWLWNMVVMLVRRAMTTEMPTDEPMLRISVHSAAPSVRSAAGRVAKAIVFSGTKMKPSPNPWTIELIAMVSAETSVDQAAEPPDQEHRHECADTARAEQIAARQHRVAEQHLDERRHQRHGGEQD